MFNSASFVSAAVAVGVVASLAGTAPAMAQFGPGVNYTEGVDGTVIQGGSVVTIPTSNPTLYLASDGEVAFDPFGSGHDTSDGIALNSGWSPDPAFAAAFANGFWTQITASAPGLPWDGNQFTWVLPASTPCGNENEPRCEPVAKWDFSGGGWLPGTPQFVKLWEPDGALSDVILLANNGPGGSATITFSSDPSLIPEPSTWAMLLLGFVGLGFVGYRTSRKAASIA
jgi:PEP-CTERM motif